MFHKGLSKEVLIEASKELIEENGIAAFSMRALAERLGVKTASLYAHIESMDALFTEIGLSALNDQKAAQLAAVEGKRYSRWRRATAPSPRPTPRSISSSCRCRWAGTRRFAPPRP